MQGPGGPWWEQLFPLAYQPGLPQPGIGTLSHIHTQSGTFRDGQVMALDEYNDMIIGPFKICWFDKTMMVSYGICNSSDN